MNKITISGNKKDLDSAIELYNEMLSYIIDFTGSIQLDMIEGYYSLSFPNIKIRNNYLNNIKSFYPKISHSKHK